MCIIVDANVATKVFSAQPPRDFAPVFEWLHAPDKDGCIVYGGRLGDELLTLEDPRRYLRELLRAGRARVFPEPALAEEENRVRLSGQCQSNDHHVIALARVSGARTLCSHDKDLHADFKNRDLISTAIPEDRSIRTGGTCACCATPRPADPATGEEGEPTSPRPESAGVDPEAHPGTPGNRDPLPASLTAEKTPAG